MNQNKRTQGPKSQVMSLNIQEPLHHIQNINNLKIIFSTIAAITVSIYILF